MTIAWNPPFGSSLTSQFSLSFLLAFQLNPFGFYQNENTLSQNGLGKSQNNLMKFQKNKNKHREMWQWIHK